MRQRSVGIQLGYQGHRRKGNQLTESELHSFQALFTNLWTIVRNTLRRPAADASEPEFGAVGPAAAAQESFTLVADSLPGRHRRSSARGHCRVRIVQATQRRHRPPRLHLRRTYRAARGHERHPPRHRSRRWQCLAQSRTTQAQRGRPRDGRRIACSRCHQIARAVTRPGVIKLLVDADKRNKLTNALCSRSSHRQSVSAAELGGARNGCMVVFLLSQLSASSRPRPIRAGCPDHLGAFTPRSTRRLGPESRPRPTTS